MLSDQWGCAPSFEAPLHRRIRASKLFDDRDGGKARTYMIYSRNETESIWFSLEEIDSSAQLHARRRSGCPLHRFASHADITPPLRTLNDNLWMIKFANPIGIGDWVSGNEMRQRCVFQLVPFFRIAYKCGATKRGGGDPETGDCQVGIVSPI